MSSSYLFGASTIGAIGGLVFWAISANEHSEDDFGVAYGLISACILVSSFSKLGFDLSVVRFYSQTSDRRRLVGMAFAVPAVASGISSAVVAAWAVGAFSSGQSENTVLEMIPFILVSVLLTISGIQYSLALASRKSKYCTAQSILLQILRIALIAPFAAFGAIGLLVSYGLGTLLAFIVIAIALIPEAISTSEPTANEEPLRPRATIRYSLAGYVQGMLQLAPMYFLPIAVLTFAGGDETAYFGVAWILGSVLLTFPASTTYALFSEGSRQPEDILVLARQSITIGLAMLSLMSIGLAIGGRYILNLFGSAYPEYSYDILLLLIASSFLYFGNELYFVIERVRFRMKNIIAVTAVGTTGILIASIAVIPLHGALGAATCWLVGQAIIMASITATMVFMRIMKPVSTRPQS